MMELIQELATASSLLGVALERYASACAEIQARYSQLTSVSRVPQVLRDAVTSELIQATSHEAKIKQAKSTIGQARNRITTLTPIYCIPSEILVQIFQLVVDDFRNTQSRRRIDTSAPKHPDFLSHVCSHWRQVTLSLPSIWSRIDLIYSHTLCSGFLARAEACVTRSRELPLDVYVRIPASHSQYAGHFDIDEFLDDVSERIRSLDLVVPTTAATFDEYLFNSCIDRSAPGDITRLSIVDHGQYTPNFLVGTDFIPEEGDFAIEPCCVYGSQEELDNIVLSVTSLRLSGLYFYWGSTAYHGLSELHLERPLEGVIEITYFQLSRILTNSPRLRVLSINLEVIDGGLLGLTTASKNPVHLEDLEVLHLGSLEITQLTGICRLFTSGSKPLQLTLKYDPSITRTSASETSVPRFLQHSNITRLHITNLGKWTQLKKLLVFLPNLRVLALDYLPTAEVNGLTFDNNRNTVPQISVQLDQLYLLNCRIDLGCICRMAKEIPIHALTFWRCRLSRDGKDVYSFEISDELSAAFRVVKFVLSPQPNPIEAWDRFG